MYLEASAQKDTLAKVDSTPKKVFVPHRPEIIYEVDEQSTLGQSMRRGRTIYLNQCLRCHGDKGQGIEGLFPPLAKSDYLMADSNKGVLVTIFGLNEKIMVNQKEYNTKMEGNTFLNDTEVADLHNFILNSWGNRARMIGINQVKTIRASRKVEKKINDLTQNK